LVYASTQHSYRELPIRLNELAPMFRAERSGVLSGLQRVRQISLDATHVFCRPDHPRRRAGSRASGHSSKAMIISPSGFAVGG